MLQKGKEWTEGYQLEYWEQKEKNQLLMNEKIRDLMTDFLTQVSIDGIDKVLNKKNLKELYKKYCGNS